MIVISTSESLKLAKDEHVLYSLGVEFHKRIVLEKKDKKVVLWSVTVYKFAHHNESFNGPLIDFD